MRYRTGEDPLLGDIVLDGEDRVGFVSHIVHFGDGPGELVIEWDDGTLGIRYSAFGTLSLLKRGAKALHEA